MNELNLKLKFEHCYGIKKLVHEFSFKRNNNNKPIKAFAIYAPNGVMKTSFARTFKDFSKEIETKDLAFPSRKTIREISDIQPNNIFVIESYLSDYQSEKISTLLANKQLKQKYEKIHKEIDNLKSELIKNLRKSSGISTKSKKYDIEKEIEDTFGKPFLDSLKEQKDFLRGENNPSFRNIKYKTIFNDNVLKFIREHKAYIEEYIEKYNKLIKESPYLKKGFDFYNAENIQKNLSSNNFFKAGHSLNLFNGLEKTEYKNDEDLRKALEEEKRKVLEDDDLKNKFDRIDTGLRRNDDLREFRSYLLNNREVLTELDDLHLFKQKVWRSYLIDHKELALELINRYERGQQQITKLIEEAKHEQTEWEEVIRIFNNRFSHLPFRLDVENKEDVILNDEVPSVRFTFKDGNDEKAFNDRDELLRILSTGERRALYILNIIFEVEARKKENNFTLFVIDDIADSFDYKNKYAIIEYLKYMSEIDNFFMIILTHNFDFYRTINSREVVLRPQCLIAIKNDDEIKLENISYLKNPFNECWRKNLHENKRFLIASIPFVRNIIEYTQSSKNKDYLLLCAVLHYKNNTPEITLNHIKGIFEKYIEGIRFPNKNLDRKVMSLIFETAEECLQSNESINLENKIIISIAIRLKAEEYMRSKITDKDFLDNLRGNQTAKLLRKYQDEFSNQSDQKKL